MCLHVSYSLFYCIVFYLILFYSIPGGGTTRTMAQAAGTTPLSIATEPAFQSALQAATGNETDIAKLHTKHLSDFGGYYLADVSFQIHTHIHNADSEHMLSIVNSMEFADSAAAWAIVLLVPPPPQGLPGQCNRHMSEREGQSPL